MAWLSFKTPDGKYCEAHNKCMALDDKDPGVNYCNYYKEFLCIEGFGYVVKCDECLKSE